MLKTHNENNPYQKWETVMNRYFFKKRYANGQGAHERIKTSLIPGEIKTKP
jgi:hypothetical protein